jgi:hypothetical protein
MFATKEKAMFGCRQLPMGNTDAHLMMTMTTERKRCKQQLSSHAHVDIGNRQDNTPQATARFQKSKQDTSE